MNDSVYPCAQRCLLHVHHAARTLKPHSSEVSDFRIGGRARCTARNREVSDHDDQYFPEKTGKRHAGGAAAIVPDANRSKHV
jgi:hypothetical protein